MLRRGHASDPRAPRRRWGSGPWGPSPVASARLRETLPPPRTTGARGRTVHALLGTRTRSRAGNAEVHDLHMARVRHHDVPWFEIAMDQPCPVDGTERLGDLDRQPEQSLARRALLGEESVESPS